MTQLRIDTNNVNDTNKKKVRDKCTKFIFVFILVQDILFSASIYSVLIDKVNVSANYASLYIETPVEFKSKTIILSV